MDALKDPNDKAARLKETGLAVLQGSGGSLKIVLVNKALFYADLLALRDLGSTITRNTYIALEHGPVVAKYKKRLVEELGRDGLAQPASYGAAKPLELTSAGHKSGHQVLTKREWDLARRVGAFFAGESSTWASRFSHENPGWMIANESRIAAGGRPQAIDMLVALQDERLYDEENEEDDDDEQLLADFEASEPPVPRL